METRRLGDTDLDLTVVGLGTWAIGGSGWDYGWGPQEEQDSIDSILEALEAGINWIDTAAVYGIGRSEEAVGKALREWGKPVIVATKCGLIGDTEGHITPRIKRESIFAEVEGSLKRLRVDQIDFYQIHWPNPPSDIEEAWIALQDLKKQGKIRWAGVSNFTCRQLQHVSKRGHVSSLQPPYSLLKRDIETDILPWCRENNCGVVAYSPLQTGALTGKVTREWVASLPDSDWRKTKQIWFQEPKLSQLLTVVEGLKPIAKKHSAALSELAVAWVLAQPGITSAIVGARKKGQISQVVGGAALKLSPADLSEIDEVLRNVIGG